MLVIRLTRVGKKNSPSYRVVVADKRKAVKRKFIEILGNYNPTANPKTLVIDKEKSLRWIGLGAQPSDTVNNLMCQLEILPKSKMIKKVYGKKTKKKDAGKEPIAKETKTETENPEAAPTTEKDSVGAPTESVGEEKADEAPAEETATETSDEPAVATETEKTETE